MNTKLFFVMMGMVAGSSAVFAQDLTLEDVSFAAPVVKGSVSSSLPASWMHQDVGVAWSQGYKGARTSITVVDDFSSANRIKGNLTGTLETLRHGEWTSKQAGLLAPESTVKTLDYTSGAKFVAGSGLNVINASYGLMAAQGYKTSQINFGPLHGSVIEAAKNGTALIAKAAGNSAVAVNGVSGGKVDYMNMALIGLPGTIFVGALEKHGSTTSKAKMASYSNYAGSNVTIQNQFLVVGVDGGKTGLYGTSFAAPQLAGYAAIIGSKFSTTSAPIIAQQLLNTARTDTILNYRKNIHGRGEASLSRALAPVSIR